MVSDIHIEYYEQADRVYLGFTFALNGDGARQYVANTLTKNPTISYYTFEQILPNITDVSSD